MTILAKRTGFGILSWYNFFQRIPFFGKWLFNRMLAWTSPYTGNIPLSVKSLSVGHCTTTMTERLSIRNPFSSIHAVALMNMGEATGGLAVLAWCEAQDTPHHAIITKLEAQYFKKVN